MRPNWKCASVWLRIDGHGILEPLNSFGILTALLVNQSELILRLAIVRVDGRRLQHPPKVLTAAQAAAQFADLAAEIVVRVEQEERRSEPSKHKSERPPEDKPLPPTESTTGTPR